ncbi:alpha/beta hydrolase [Amycolatopsis carbonis]|uniref:Alpha/beta hydrolase n=1 Tax=Amycolatopsis carbonis TaxID=715471 RepID=A0A9Y2IMG1_9PSEU|nr:alpha/beta hydrolase [Amycolatopsis sp. 2-15]WIX81303.1 alpha/beta hydrolase [Amycolatopsis sp. 2-15]
MTTDVPDAGTDPRIERRVREFLAELNKNPDPFWLLPGEQVRATLSGLQATVDVDLSGVDTEERDVEVDGVRTKLYVQRPAGSQETLPVVLFLHGGVWIAGDFDNHRRLTRDLVLATGYAVVFVEYTPIPDAVFPTQLEECFAALKWVAREGASQRLDASRLAVAGNSVGGNLSAALTMYTRDHDGPPIKAQLLMYPATDARVDTESYSEFNDGRFLPRAFMKFGWDVYAPDEATRANPYASPLRATVDQLRGLPPAIVHTSSNDVLRDEGVAYAHKLDEAGVDVISVQYVGQIHDMALLNPIHDVPSTRAEFRHAAADLKHLLS